jgi:hypothetical protein
MRTTPNAAAVATLLRRRKADFSLYWQEVKSSPAYVLIILTAAILWAFFMAWMILPAPA